MTDELKAAGVSVTDVIKRIKYVAAVPMDKPTLVAEVRKRGLKSVSAVLRELGKGEDEKSKNGLASLLKSIWHDEYVDERDA